MRRTKPILQKLTLFAVSVLLSTLAAFAVAEGVPAHQRVSMKRVDTTMPNKSVVRQWVPETYNPDVTAYICGLADAFTQQYKNTLEKAANNTSRNSLLETDTRYSRTGDDWLSFLVSARITFHRKIIKTDIASATFDMLTGERIKLTDMFDADSAAWVVLTDAVYEQIHFYFPDREPDAKALGEALENIRDADFTLHAMSLTLHYPAELFYKDCSTLIEVQVMYPLLEGLMNERAARQTNNRARKMIALTYDDGPKRTETTRLLNKLREYGALGTFFVVGNRIADNLDLVQREHDEGHAVAAHNWTHADVSKMKASTIQGYRPKFDEALIKAIGIPSRYDRVPYGLYPKMIEAKAGWPYIQWSVDTYDWRGRKPYVILNNIRNVVRDGDIVLFHDIKPLSADIADAILPFLIDEGFMFVTVDELFARDGVQLEAERVYYRCNDGVTGRRED